MPGRAGPRPDAEDSCRTSTPSSARRNSRSWAMQLAHGARVSTTRISPKSARCSCRSAARPIASPDAFSHLRAFVTVQRGCSYYCTFCIVPHVRGRFDHRPLGAISSTKCASSIARRRARGDAGRTNGQRVERSGDRRGFRRSVQARRAACPGLERLTLHFAASQRFHRENHSPISPRCRSSTRACICRCNRPAIRCCGG